MRRSVAIVLSRRERRTLKRWAGDATDPELAARAQAILLAEKGESNVAIARVLRRRKNTVRDWRNRFFELRLASLVGSPYE
jgi:DNA-binding NarL/FixJ family response regulator